MPLLPGVYWFLDKNGQVLYVGKAKKLKNRVKSYRRFQQLSSKIKQMVSTAVEVKFMVLESELEALLTEAELIRTYQPDFNTLLKDDKSPLYIHITSDDYPRVLRVRKKNLIKYKPKGTILGPFSSAYKTQEVLKIARKIFPWCNKVSKKGSDAKISREILKPCFYYHLELCPGSCVEEISKKDYTENINQLILFLKGKKLTVSKNLKEQMTIYSENQKYEKAALIRDQLQMIKFVTRKNHRLKPELVSHALQNKISEDGIIYLQNILSNYLGLPKQIPLTRIEGYDVSNTQGTNPAVSMVVFTNGKADNSNYRIFNIKSLNTPNDYGMMKEAIARRQNHPEWGVPNLVVVDGGKGQVRSALQVWDWKCPVIGIAKKPDRLVLPKINWGKWGKHSKSEKENDITFKDGKKIISNKIKKIKILKDLDYYMVKLEANHPSLKLIQQIRDESHRFSQKQHKKKRLNGMFE